MRVPLFVLLTLLAALCPPVIVGAQPRQPLPFTQDPTISLELALRLDDVLREADKLRAGGQLAAARARLEAMAAEAEQLGARRHQAAALWSIGRTLNLEGNRPAAKASLIKSRELYRASGLKVGEASATRLLGMMHYYDNEFDAARALFHEALAIFEEIQDADGLALAYNNLLYVYQGPEKDAIRAKAIASARASDNLGAECGVLHEWGDDLFDDGDFVPARSKLLDALHCYERLKEADNIGRTLVSLGRVQRAHGQYQSALDYYTRALAVQQASGEPDLGAVQSLNAIATIYMYMGRHDDVLAYLERALAEAKRLKSATTVTFLTGQIGNHYVRLRDYEKAIPMLEASLQPNQKSAHVAFRHTNLATAYHGIGQLARAQEYADLAVAESRPIGPDSLAGALTTRADIARARGDYAAAERDLREAVQLTEEVRAKLIPIDFMKRGYAEAVQNIYAATIELQMEQRHWRAALETAEQARARAFLDLLASRTPTAAKVGTDANAVSTPTPAPAPDAPTAAGSATASPAGNGSSLTRRGGTAGDGAQVNAPIGTQTRAGTAVLDAIEGTAGGGVGAQLGLDSSRSAPPADMTAMIATAKRLRSTLLAYWVGQQGTFAWVVTPAGRVQATRIDVPAMQLESLAAQANQAVNNADGGGFALMGRSQTRPWRELYALLIKPVRAYLPATPNSLLTIVPHGPLFGVSFAALQDERDRYLVERYRLHYTPAIGVLQFTAQHPRTTPKHTRRALLVGDPGALTPEPGGDTMPALPWARREVDEIAAHLPTGASRLLVDTRATEADVRSTLDGMDLVHFATHGVVRQERALSSFLALRGDGETDPARDGRLTAEEVYGLDLRARLVVLSACGTALGPMTGDGVIGFTRAFLYAGASSVIATEWDVPDEAGYELMRRFYRERALTGRDSDALRSAQLGVIQALRKGTMKVATPGGDVALPEHPLFWAGFVLVGEP